MDSNINPSVLYLVYKNVFELIKFRGYTIDTKPASSNDFTATLTENNLVKVTDSQDESKKPASFAAVIVGPLGNRLKAGQINKFFNEVISCNTIIIVNDERKIKSITGFIAKNQIPFRIETALYYNFYFNLPEHVQFTQYELVSPEDVKQWKREERRSESQLPTVYSSDASVKWYGFKEGDIVIEKQPSPNACTAMQLKLVVK